MDIKDIAALVQIRNYAFSVREDRNVFRGDAYQQVTSQINRIDKFLSTVLTKEDLVKMVLDVKPAQTIEETPVKKVSKASKKSAKKVESTSKALNSQVPLNFETTFADLDDAALLSKRIREEKEKLASRKSGK